MNSAAVLSDGRLRTRHMAFIHNPYVACKQFGLFLHSMHMKLCISVYRIPVLSLAPC